MRPGLHAADGGELEGLARVGPVTAAAPAFGGPVPDQKAVTELVLRPPDDEVQGVLAHRQGFARPPADGEILGPEGRDVLAKGVGDGSVRAFADDAQLAVNLARRGDGVGGRERRLDVAFEPLIAEVLFDAGLFWVVEERIRESEGAPPGVEVERPLDRRGQPGWACFFLFVLLRGRVGRDALCGAAGRSEEGQRRKKTQRAALVMSAPQSSSP